MDLTVLDGASRCTCCGCQVDAKGDHLLSCRHMLHLRTGPWHDALLDVFVRMCRVAGHRVSVDSRRHRDVSRFYSPLWCPYASIPHAAPNGGHVLLDVTTASVTTASALPSSAENAGDAAEHAEHTKRATYGNVAPSVLVPLAVEEGGALGREAMRLVKSCKKKCKDDPRVVNEAELNWSNRGFMNWAMQPISLANVKGLSHFLLTAASALHH